MAIEINQPALVYAEGEWTPVIAGTSTPGTQTYSTQVGRYIRVGNLVTAWFNLGIATVDGAIAGNVLVTGLPFTVSNIASYRPVVALGAFGTIDLSVGYTQLTARATENTTEIAVQQGGDNVANLGLPVAALAVSSSIGGCLTYRTG